MSVGVFTAKTCAVLWLWESIKYSRWFCARYAYWLRKWQVVKMVGKLRPWKCSFLFWSFTYLSSRECTCSSGTTLTRCCRVPWWVFSVCLFVLMWVNVSISPVGSSSKHVFESMFSSSNLCVRSVRRKSTFRWLSRKATLVGGVLLCNRNNHDKIVLWSNTSSRVQSASELVKKERSTSWRELVLCKGNRVEVFHEFSYFSNFSLRFPCGGKSDWLSTKGLMLEE